MFLRYLKRQKRKRKTQWKLVALLSVLESTEFSFKWNKSFPHLIPCFPLKQCIIASISEFDLNKCHLSIYLSQSSSVSRQFSSRHFVFSRSSFSSVCLLLCVGVSTYLTGAGSCWDISPILDAPGSVKHLCSNCGVCVTWWRWEILFRRSRGLWFMGPPFCWISK